VFTCIERLWVKHVVTTFATLNMKVGVCTGFRNFTLCCFGVNPTCTYFFFHPYSCTVLSFFHSFFHQWLCRHLSGPGLFFRVVIFFYAYGRIPWTSDQPDARPLPIHRTTQTQNKSTHTYKHIHVLSGIRIHDPSIRASEDSSCLRPRGHSDRRPVIY
jgi:hypothetical protein